MGTGWPLGRAPHVHPSRSLTLEWNNLGTWEDAFATFCRALAGNSTLQQLDLRNNQVSHKGAEELALVLKSHPSLQQLGEAWAEPASCCSSGPLPGATGWQWVQEGEAHRARLLCG